MSRRRGLRANYYGFSGKLSTVSMMTKLTRPYAPRYNFRAIRVGTLVKWIEPLRTNADGSVSGGEMTGQVWSRAPRGGEWWVVDSEGKAHKLHWRKFSKPRGPG